MSAPRYLAKLRALAARIPAGSVAHVDVRHDSDCPLLRRAGPCTCDAEVVLVPGPVAPGDARH